MSMECHLLKAISHCSGIECSWLVANSDATCPVGARGKVLIVGRGYFADSDSVIVSTDVVFKEPDFTFDFCLYLTLGKL